MGKWMPRLQVRIERADGEGIWLFSLPVAGDSTTGCFFSHWYPPKKLKYGKPRLGESTLTLIGLDTPNLA